ncbi:hypothetical protein CRG98_005923 [Punica granatum]|uniref:Uncharacterized protein n=1 Tax=Punica granatum TaxID=22663 RepID=A0A2I0KZ03_PUNGR|nr:hypothetical protein CRG98_005923 [Punica granatum]
MSDPRTVQSGLFPTCSIFRDLCKVIQVNPTTLEPNDHHSHLWESLRSREPPTLHQIPLGASGRAVSFLTTSWKIYTCSPPETIAGTLSILLVFWNIRALSEKPPESPEPTCFILGASRVCQRPVGSVQLHSICTTKPAQIQPQPDSYPPDPTSSISSRILGLGIIISDLEELELLHFLCVCGVIRRS